MRLLDFIDALKREAQAHGQTPTIGPKQGPGDPRPSLLPLPNAALPPMPPAPVILPTGPTGLTAPWPQDPGNPWLSGMPFPFPVPPAAFPAPRQPVPAAPAPSPVPSGTAPRPRLSLLGPDEDDRLPLSQPPAAQPGATMDMTDDSVSMPAQDSQEIEDGEVGGIGQGYPELAQAPSSQQRRKKAAPSQQPKPALPSPESTGPEASTIATQVVAIPQDDGSFEVRKGGTRSWRNNNPTNLKYETKEDAFKNGAIGVDDDGFAIFASEEAGNKAGLANLSNPKYRARTINRAIEKFAPKHENDTAAYQRFVQTQTGLPGETRIGSLTPQQMQRLYDVIVRFEGWKAGTTTVDRQ